MSRKLKASKLFDAPLQWNVTISGDSLLTDAPRQQLSPVNMAPMVISDNNTNHIMDDQLDLDDDMPSQLNHARPLL
jgi:hypothetical protein